MKQMKDETNILNSDNTKEYFNLSELEEITGLKLRALKYRMLIVKEKYKERPNLAKKVGRKWRLHYSIIDDFLPKYSVSKKTVYNLDWESTSTWNPKNNYDIDYHKQLVKEIKEQLPNNKIAFTIETDERNVYHTHLISDAKNDKLKEVVEAILSQYLTLPSECIIKTTKIFNKYSLIEYIKKASLAGDII